MQQRAFGRTGMSVSVLGFGGSEIGYENADDAAVSRLLYAALDAGLNVIDTAECYMDSEEKIGRAVSHRRGDFFLFTKVGHEHGWGRDDWSPASIARSIDRSLKRLRTDCVDLLQLHSCSADVIARGDATAALEKAKAAGKTRFIGYSGDSTDALEAVRTSRFDTLQISISIADQEAIDLVLPEAAKRGMGVIAKRPIANAAWRHAKRPAGEYGEEYWRRLTELKYAFATPGNPAPDAAAIALRFTLTVPGVHTAIVGTKNPDRWAQNAAAVKAGALTKAEYEAIRARWRAVARRDWVGQV